MLDKGFIKLVDSMGDDEAIVDAARVSYAGIGSSTTDELIRYLMRSNHGTPLEMCQFKFHAKMPLFVARQWMRHRSFSFNEISGRYSVMKDECYVPENLRLQSSTNKQGSEAGAVEREAKLMAIARENRANTFWNYNDQIACGVSKELARIDLPLSLYTEMYMSVDLRNLLHFLGLRSDSHAQEEIRVYSDAIIELIRPIVPLTVAAWNDYHPLRSGMLLSRMEIQALKLMFKGITEPVSKNKREQKEWEAKLKQLLGN